MANDVAVNKIRFSIRTVFEVLPAQQQSRPLTPYFTSIPTEVRFEILQHLLPDVDRILCWSPEASNVVGGYEADGVTLPSSFELRQDGEKCHPAIMRSCRSVYEDCLSIIYSPGRTFMALLRSKAGPRLCLLDSSSLMPSWSPGVGHEESLKVLLKRLGHVRSLHLLLAPYERQFSYGRTLREIVDVFTKLLLDEFPNKLPITNLTVELSAKSLPAAVGSLSAMYVCKPGPRLPLPPPPPLPPMPSLPRGFLHLPQPANIDISYYSGLADYVADQLHLQWVLSPLARLSGFRSDCVRFLICGKTFEEIDNPALPSLTEFVGILRTCMTQKHDQCARWELPKTLVPLGKLMACSHSLSALEAFFDAGEEIDVQQTVTISQRPDYKVSAPMLWLWDAWRREDWAQIRAANAGLRKDWQRMFQSTESTFAKLDRVIQASEETKSSNAAVSPE